MSTVQLVPTDSEESSNFAVGDDGYREVLDLLAKVLYRPGLQISAEPTPGFFRIVFQHEGETVTMIVSVKNVEVYGLIVVLPLAGEADQPR